MSSVGPFALVWAPLVAIAALSVAFGPSEGSRRVLSLAGIAMVAAIGLSVPVWHYSLRRPWPEQPNAGFLARHVLAALGFSIAWVLVQYALNPFRERDTLGALMASHSVPWQLLAGVWLYGIVAGMAYAAQARARAAALAHRAGQAEAMAATMRLQALEARLNPHFLFNALHTLGSISHDAATRSAAEQLGDLLRYSLRKGTGLVPLADELEFTSKYLGFEQLRFEDRLTVCWQVDPSVRSVGIPAFTIQTLVENAVHHSIARRPEGGRIDVEAARREGNVVIAVSDDGTDPPDGSGDGHSGFGLSALRERLASEFGAEARVAVDARSHGGYRVVVEVPERLPSASGRIQMEHA